MPPVKVSIILCISGDFWKSKTILQTLLSSCVTHELLVYNRGQEELRLFDLYKDIANEYLTSSDFPDDTSAINHLLKKVNGAYVVVMNNEYILHEDWMFKLLDFYNSIEQIGLLTIPENKHVKSLLYNYALKRDYTMADIYVSEDSENYGIHLFSKQVLKQIGAFDDSLSSTLAMKQYSLRNTMLGLHSYYITGISCISLTDHAADTKIQLDKYKESLVHHRSTSPYIALHELTPFDRFVYSELDNLAESFKLAAKKFYKSYSGEYGIISKSITKQDIDLVNEFSNRLNLNYSIRPVSELKNSLQNTFILISFELK